jgi:hypothetical protein
MIRISATEICDTIDCEPRGAHHDFAQQIHRHGEEHHHRARKRRRVQVFAFPLF